MVIILKTWAVCFNLGLFFADVPNGSKEDSKEGLKKGQKTSFIFFTEGREREKGECLTDRPNSDFFYGLRQLFQISPAHFATTVFDRI